ncbi:protein ARV 1-like isoform X2 [Magnolia sinica]|uniref:protein ARV 1-like isoform X2 n=1 Tax=Magnolia sinica TaxID=86752 RepID=UPI002659921A|nr:protein ARV 1-like isoform X2 [Magnolia sinica]
MEKRCVHCGNPVKTLLLQYSPGNIRLMKCGILWKSIFGYLFLDACRHLISNNSKEEFASSTSSLSSIPACGKMLMEILLGNFAFFGFLVFATRFLMKSSQVIWNKDVLLAILVSSYFKIFLIAMMVWEFPSSVLFIIDVFVLSSNAVALTVLTQVRMTGCIGACIGAHAAKLAANRVLEVLPSGYLRCFSILDW